MCVIFTIIFFFSSRRRHTRCSRDWSSDVCSSDLSTASSPCPCKSPKKLSFQPLNGKKAIGAAIPTLMPTLPTRSEEHTSELQSRLHLVCRLLLEKKKMHNGLCLRNYLIIHSPNQS